MRLKFVILISLLAACSLQLTALRADTIRKNDNRELKGIVVEDYKDRIVFSTVDGEVTVMKSDIRALSFDSEEDNLLGLGRQAQDRRDYLRALAYYDKALKLNPGSTQARELVAFLQGYHYEREEIKKRDDIKRREEFERYGAVAGRTKSGDEELKESAGKLRRMIGMSLAADGGLPKVDGVDRDSPVYNAGIKKGDTLIAVQGRLTGYISLKEVTDALIDKPSFEVRCAIERTVDVEINQGVRLFSGTDRLIGASFKMEFDGLTVSNVKEGEPAFLAGIHKGDLIVRIEGQPTRYMPLKQAVELIKRSDRDSVKLTFQRQFIIWRRD